MSTYQVDIEYKIVEGTAFNLELDPSLDPEEKEQIILEAFRESIMDGEEITDIEITNIKELR